MSHHSNPTLRPDWLTEPEDPAVLPASVWPEAFARDERGELTVDGVPVTELAERFGTPLYVTSETVFRSRARDLRESFERAFAEVGAEVSVYYAGKAFLCSEAVRWARAEGLNLDTASGGELAVGLAAGMEPARIALHGNNKSAEEIARALEAGVGRIVADSVPELLMIERLAEQRGVTAPVMIRVTPGVHAETHEFIATAHEDQKFGLSLAADTGALTLPAVPEPWRSQLGAGPEDSAAVVAALLAEQLPHLDLRGLHCHIGSQIFASEGFELAAQRVLSLMAGLAERFGRELPEVDLGGGYGIGYLPADRPRGAEDIAGSLARSIAEVCRGLGLSLPHLSIEPGRVIAGPAGITLYTVGTLKDVAVGEREDGQQVRRYVAVDGGMSDNARPILYDADYTVTLAGRAPEGEQVLSRVVGKHCESGDVVIRDCLLPADLRPGDLLAVPATGAYCWSLSSNYNWLPRPAVVATRAGAQPRVIVRGQSEADLLARDPGLVPDPGPAGPEKESTA